MNELVASSVASAAVEALRSYIHGQGRHQGMDVAYQLAISALASVVQQKTTLFGLGGLQGRELAILLLRALSAGLLEGRSTMAGAFESGFTAILSDTTAQMLLSAMMLTTGTGAALPGIPGSVVNVTGVSPNGTYPPPNGNVTLPYAGVNTVPPQPPAPQPSIVPTPGFWGAQS